MTDDRGSSTPIVTAPAPSGWVREFDEITSTETLCTKLMESQVQIVTVDL